MKLSPCCRAPVQGDACKTCSNVQGARKVCARAPSWARQGQAEELRDADCTAENPLPTPSYPRPHSPGPRAASHLPYLSQVFPGEETRVGLVSCSKSETRAILNSSVAKGTEPKGQKAPWGRG